jgi:Flp pilus assembly secretin CpaC
MRPAAFLLAALFAVTAVVSAETPRANVRVLLQLIELPHPALIELMAGPDTSGKTLHASAMALVKAGQAKVLESAVITTRDGQKASVESFRAVIYATEYEAPALPCDFHHNVAPADYFANRSPSAWDTRMVGVTVEVTPSIAEDRRSIGLVLDPEISEQAGERMWNSWLGPHGHYDIRMPDFRALRAKLDVTLVPGVFEMATVLSPAPTAPAPAVLRKVLVFVRADLLPHPAPAAR